VLAQKLSLTSPHNSHSTAVLLEDPLNQGAVGNEIEMSEPIESFGHATAVGNLLTLANVFRDDGKYVIASALYRRAIAFLDGMNPSEARHALLIKILEDQLSLERKMSCGHAACMEGARPLTFFRTLMEPES
jgi:hypothetical protein